MNNAGAWPEHHCKVAGGALLNETIPKEEDGSYSKCKMHDASDRNKTVKCNQWEYFGDTGYTIVSEVTELDYYSIRTSKIGWYPVLLSYSTYAHIHLSLATHIRRTR